MQPIVLETIDDPRVADYRAIGDPELLRTRGLFVAEGRLVVQRLVEDGRHRVRSILVSPAALRALGPTFQRLDAAVPVYVCVAERFVDLTGFNIHRGCLALAERPAPLPCAALLSDARLVIVLENVGNADNVGGIFRNAAAFGADVVLLSPGCCDPLYRKAIRTSMAAAIRVPFAWIDDWPAGLAALAAREFALVALTPRQPAVSLDEFVRGGRPERIAILVGGEDAGLTAAAEGQADYRLRIPIAPAVDSLNVSVAAAIALSRLSRLTDLANLE